MERYSSTSLSVLASNGLSTTARLAHCIFSAHAAGSLDLSLSMKDLARMLGVYARQAQRAVDELVSEGWLEREGRRLSLKKESFLSHSLSKKELYIQPPIVPQTAPPRRRRSVVYTEQFEEFWRAYPSKTRKAHALLAWNRALNSASVATILEGLARSMEVWRSEAREPRFIPHPATWLNGQSWLDERPARVGRVLNLQHIADEARRSLMSEGIELDTIEGQAAYRKRMTMLAWSGRDDSAT